MANELDRRKLRQAHGMTVEQMEELALKQSGQLDTEIKTVPANNAKNLKDKFFIADGHKEYQLPEHEKHIFHVIQENRSFNSATGERLDQPARVQKYDKQVFEHMVNNRGFEGQVVFVLHDPRIGTAEAKNIKPLGIQTPVNAPANRERFAETQLHEGEGTDANDPNPTPRKTKVTEDGERGGSEKQSGGTEGQQTQQNSEDVPSDSWTVPQLKEYAKDNEIAIASDDKKDDILKKIRKASK